MKILKIGFSLFIALCFAACAKEEGEGGLASVNGVVMVQYVNYHTGKLFGRLQPAQDERVFILYGNNSNSIGDDTRTSFDGSFEFSFLVEGNYTVFSLSDDTTNVNGTLVEVKKEVSLNSKKAKIQADTIILYRFLEFDEGSSSIQGKVARTYVNILDNNGNVIGFVPTEEDDNSSVVQDIEIILTMEDCSAILERTRTDANGEFTFPNLIPGRYRVYVIEEKIADFYPKPIVSAIREITEDNQQIVLPPFRGHFE